MQKTLLISLLFFLHPLVVPAQADSLVHYKDLQFTTPFEKEAFSNFFHKNDKGQYLALLVSANPSAKADNYQYIRGRMEELHAFFSTSEIEKKKPDKKIKAIYEKVHGTLLEKYEMENRFHEIFAIGNYNCVTATALYALVFEDLGIPYEIKEEPTHVYLLAFPNTNNILVETTTPMFGYLNFDAKFKESFVTTLKHQKIVGDSELQQKSVDELFNKYYFRNEKIDLTRLIGIHYMNDALFKNDHHKIPEAYQQIQKAYMFYPSPRCEYLLMHLGVLLMNEPKLPSAQKARLLAQVSRLTSQGITDEMIKGEFTNLTVDILLRDNNRTLYKECYDIVMAGITDKELSEDISFIYNFEIGRVYYNQGNYGPARNYFQVALSYQPNNVELGAIFSNTIAQSFRHEKNSKILLDSLSVYGARFPSLRENNNYLSMEAVANLFCFGDEYRKGNTKDGEKYRAVFEEMAGKNKNLNVNAQAIGSAYSAASSYYFRKGQKARAKEILLKGLELAPDNYEMRERLQMIR